MEEEKDLRRHSVIGVYKFYEHWSTETFWFYPPAQEILAKFRNVWQAGT